MLKLGIVGATAIYHARTFAEMFNGYDAEAAKREKWPLYDVRVEGARVTHVWDEDIANAKTMAAICGVENVVSNPEDMIGKVDGILIPDDCTMKHHKRAAPFLKAGMPTFVDKPLSADIAEAEAIVAMANEYGAPMMSCSALRYAKEVEEFLANADSVGEILTGSVMGPNELVFYGIHALTLLRAIVQTPIKSVQNMGEPGAAMVIVTMEDGRKFLFSTHEKARSGFEANLYGTAGAAHVRVSDAAHYYSTMLKDVVKMVETGKAPFPPEESLEIIRALVYAKQSATTHQVYQV